MLVVEGVPGAIDLKAFHAERDDHPHWIGRMVGEALARVHSAGPPGAAAAGASPPWGLSVHRPTVDGLRHPTPASLDLIRAIQGDQSVGRALDALREAWSQQALVHNDVKWENLLLADAGTASPGLWIVDREDAAEGDPLWDVGCAAAAHLGAWLRTIDVTRSTGSDGLHTLARIPLMRRPRPSARSGTHTSTAARWLTRTGAATRTARFAGARLLVSAHESTQAGGRFGPHLVLYAQMGANLLTRPESALASVGLAAARG